MARKFKVWLDSGANIHSKRQVIITLDEIGIEDDDWDEMSDDDKDEVMKEIAFDSSDWGYAEVDALAKQVRNPMFKFRECEDSQAIAAPDPKEAV